MFIRPINVRKNGKDHSYWSLVESYRTSHGPRQRTVSYLSELDAAGRLGVQSAAEEQSHKRRAGQRGLFDNTEPRWVEVDTKRVRVENVRDFGGYWLGLELIKSIGLDRFLAKAIPAGRESVSWSEMVQVLILCRLNFPSSELHIAEHLYDASGLEYLLGLPSSVVDDNRLYRALDALLPHKESLEVFLKEKLGNLFELDYDIVLYDVTSVYFEGEAKRNPQAKRGYSRDKRFDCKQVCIALVVSREGIPFGYEVFDGNRNDVTTVREIVEKVESRYGKSRRIWCLDRGMISEETVKFLRAEGRRYIVGTPRSMLKRFERELLADSWQEIYEGLEVKSCQSPEGGEIFVLCRSRARREKESAIHCRFENRIESGLKEIEADCNRRKRDPLVIAKNVGKLLGRNSRSAGLFKVEIRQGEGGRARLKWRKVESWREWANRSEGCYLLRSNVTDWSAQDLWGAYIQLTQAENAFRIQKSDLKIRPVWHQKGERVHAHILVCFLAYVLWKSLAQLCKRAGIGDEPRRVFDEIGRIKTVDVILPTREGNEIRLRCVAEPTKRQRVLIERLGLYLPRRLRTRKCSENF